MYLTPNFEVNKDEDSNIITPQLDAETNSVKEYMVVEKLGAGTMPITMSEKVDRNKVVLAELDSLQKMYLYPNGEIKIER